MNNQWHNFKEYNPPKPDDTTRNFYYLCEVSGLEFCRYVVLMYDCGGRWWIFVPKIAGIWEGGWLGLPDDMQILRWKFIEND